MAKLRVTIIDEVRNRRLKVDLPDDAAMEKLLPALAEKLGLPATDPGGQPIAYRLTHEATGRALGGDQTLASFGVREGDALRLAMAVDLVRVLEPEEEAVPTWQKVPVWGWVGIVVVVLLAVAALAFLAGRGVKPEPTPTVVAEVTTLAATEAPTLPAPAPTATLAPPTRTPTPRPPTPTLTPKSTVPSANLTVLVSDAGSGQPVAGAQVRVSSFSLGYDQTQQTNIDGQATFAGLRPSSHINYSIRVVAEGYRTYIGDAQVSGVGEHSTMVALQPPTDTPVPPTATPVLPTPTSAPEAAPIPADPWGQVIVPPGEKVQIALVTDFSTEWADVGADQRNAGQMAAEDAGPIKGFPVNLINVDGGCSSGQPAKAEGAANTIVLNPSIVGVVGHSCSSSCNPAAPIYEGAHIAMIISGCADPTLSEHGYEVFNRATAHGPLEEAAAWNEQVEKSSSYQAFVSRYQARYGAPPAQGPKPEYHLSVISAYTYDAMAILIRAIEQVAAVDGAGNLVIGRQALARAVRATAGYQGVTGVISFDGKGDRLP